MSEMLKEVAKIKEDARAQARAETPLPQGAAPIEAEEPEPAPEEVAAAPEEAPTPEAPPPEEPETLIRIGSQTFKSQAEAIKYAEQLEQEKLYAEAYQQGVRETIQAHSPAPAPAPEEDNFEEEFYTSPKQTFIKMTEKAKQEALAVIKAEQHKENLWKTFEDKYPDVDRKDAEQILAQNMDTLGKMTDIDKAMEVLARKTRAEYQRIVERFKPRTELPPARGQAVVPSTSAARGVTPAKKDEPPLTMAQQMKRLREQKRNSPA